MDREGLLKLTELVFILKIAAGRFIWNCSSYSARVARKYRLTAASFTI